MWSALDHNDKMLIIAALALASMLTIASNNYEKCLKIYILQIVALRCSFTAAAYFGGGHNK